MLINAVGLLGSHMKDPHGLFRALAWLKWICLRNPPFILWARTSWIALNKDGCHHQPDCSQ